MSKSPLILSVGLIAVSTASIYFWNTNRGLKTEVAGLKSELKSARVSELRAVKEAEEANRKAVAALSEAAAAAATQAALPPAGSPVQPPVPAAPAAVLVNGGGMIDPTTGEVIEFRAPPLKPGALSVLPTVETFESAYFPTDGSIATPQQHLRATTALLERINEVEGYRQAHGGLDVNLSTIRQTSDTFAKDNGIDPTLSAALRNQYRASIQRVAGQAISISTRATERPDAKEVSKQIAALANAILTRLPKE